MDVARWCYKWIGYGIGLGLDGIREGWSIEHLGANKILIRIINTDSIQDLAKRSKSIYIVLLNLFVVLVFLSSQEGLGTNC